MLITDHLKDRNALERNLGRPAEPRVLIADDQPDVLEALRLLLKGEGFQIETASSPAGVLARARGAEFDVALIDLNYARDTTSGEEGLDLLSRIQGIDPTLPVVVMTAWGSVDLAVEAMRRGARDFVQKPWDNARLLAIVRTQVELSQALRKGQRLEAENSLLRGEGMPKLIAESPAMQPVLQMIARVGPSDANVLITGENGTGKGVVARALHAVSTARRGRWSPSTPAACPKACSRASCSATCAARSPTPRPIASAASSWPTAARCSSTRSPTCR